jgi:hypothetical protein
MDAETERLTRQLQALAIQRARARGEHERVTERLREVVIALVLDHGMSEHAASKAGKISRQTVRVWVGSDTHWPK